VNRVTRNTVDVDGRTASHGQRTDGQMADPETQAFWRLLLLVANAKNRHLSNLNDLIWLRNWHMAYMYVSRSYLHTLISLPRRVVCY